MKVCFSILSLIWSIHFVLAFQPPDDYKLELVQVLFRHGDRIPDKAEIYDTDPYDEIYQKHGYGLLTKVGQEREYQIGRMLRERYGDFLGDFKNSDVYAYSTNVDRTKMSLQLVLAGLYPPSTKTSWNDRVNWLPIPTHYDPFDKNFLGGFACSTYRKLFNEVAKSADIREKLEKYEGFYESLRNKTGITTFTPSGVYMIYCNIRAAESLGLPRPNWCTDEDYQNLLEISALFLGSLTQTDPMKRTMAGLIIEKFLQNIEKENEKKIYLYAAHDVNVASFTNVHNITDIPEIPDYGSTIIFEKLRGKDDRLYVRMFMWTGIDGKLIPLKLDECESTCLLSNYKRIVESVMPDDFARRCTSVSNFCSRRRSIDDDGERMDASLLLSYLFAGEDLNSFKYMKDFVIPNV